MFRLWFGFGSLCLCEERILNGNRRVCDVGVVLVGVDAGFSGGSLGGTGGGGNLAYSLGGPIYISLLGSTSRGFPVRIRILFCVGVSGKVSECDGVCLAGDDDCLSMAGLVPDRFREGSVELAEVGDMRSL